MKNINNKKRRILTLICIISLLLLSLVQLVPSSTNSITSKVVYVDNHNTKGPWDGSIRYPFKNIQEGIDSANDGSTIYVLKGEYTENIVINKSINLIGESKQSTIIHGTDVEKWYYHIISIFEGGENSTIKNFKIDNNEDYRKTGICIKNANHINIQNNILLSSNNITWEYDGHHGKHHGMRAIEAHNCRYLTISNNYFNDFTYSFQIYSSDNILIEHNQVENCQYVIGRSHIDKSTFCKNSITKTPLSWFEGSNNLIEHNVFDGCNIQLSGTRNIFKSNSVRTSFGSYLLKLTETSFNIISKNNFFIEEHQYPLIVSKLRNLPNRWIGNYWNKTLLHPQFIRKIIILPFRDKSGILYRISWFESDWFPSNHPYDI